MRPGIVDTHAHLADAVFDADRAEVLERARKAGVSAVITLSERLADARQILALAQEHPMIRPAIGLYPTHLNMDEADAMLAVIRNERDKLCAIGEVGLDYWKIKEEEQQAVQRNIFRQFIELACELELPLNVHARSAGRHAIALLLECGAKNVQMHSFDGKASSARPAMEAGYFFSIPTSIRRSRQKQKLVKQLPLSCLLVESDSPVLAPNPDDRNEPANVVLVVEAIAKIKDVSREEVVDVVAENTKRLYGEPF